MSSQLPRIGLLGDADADGRDDEKNVDDPKRNKEELVKSVFEHQQKQVPEPRFTWKHYFWGPALAFWLCALFFSNYDASYSTFWDVLDIAGLPFGGIVTIHLVKFGQKFYFSDYLSNDRSVFGFSILWLFISTAFWMGIVAHVLSISQYNFRLAFFLLHPGWAVVRHLHGELTWSELIVELKLEAGAIFGSIVLFFLEFIFGPFNSVWSLLFGSLGTVWAVYSAVDDDPSHLTPFATGLVTQTLRFNAAGRLGMSKDSKPTTDGVKDASKKKNRENHADEDYLLSSIDDPKEEEPPQNFDIRQLGRETDTFKKLERMFLKTNKCLDHGFLNRLAVLFNFTAVDPSNAWPNARVANIYEVQTPKIGRWMEANKTIRPTSKNVLLPSKAFQCDEFKTKNHVLLFHGTSIKGALSISNNGFHCSLRGALGAAVYLTDCAAKALNYCECTYCSDTAYCPGYHDDGRIGKFYILVCEVCLGNTQVTKEKIRNAREPKRKYDSIVAYGRKAATDSTFWYTEYSIFNPDRVLLKYVIEVEKVKIVTKHDPVADAPKKEENMGPSDSSVPRKPQESQVANAGQKIERAEHARKTTALKPEAKRAPEVANAHGDKGKEEEKKEEKDPLTISGVHSIVHADTMVD